MHADLRVKGVRERKLPWYRAQAELIVNRRHKTELENTMAG